MNAPVTVSGLSRRALLKGGALTVGFALGGIPLDAIAQGAAPEPRILDAKEVDAFLAVNGDGTVTVFCGKVDLGQGLRIAIPQIAAEELGIGIDKITYVEGDTALTPDQGRTSGSNGIQRGGVQIRQAAATARKALTELAAQRLNAKPDDLVAVDGEIRPKAGGAGIKFTDLVGARRFDLKLDPKAPLKNPASYTLVGKPLPRPDVPAKCTGKHVFMHDFSVPGMLHGRVIRPAAIGAKLESVDESSIKQLPTAKVVRIKDFLAVVAEDEWTALRAARALRAQWSAGSGLPAQDNFAATMRADPNLTDETLVTKGAPGTRPAGAKVVSASYFWPMQSHALDRSLLRGGRRPRRFRDGVDRLAGHARQSTNVRPVPRPSARESTADLSRGVRLLRHERPRRRRRRRCGAVACRRSTGARAMVARGRARLGPEGPCAASRHFRCSRCRRSHPRLAHRDVDSTHHARNA